MMLIFLSIFLFLFPSSLCLPDEPYHYYLQSKPKTPSKSTNVTFYLSSSITLNGHTNYVLLTPPSLAQPLHLYAGDGSITLDTSNVIGASSQAPLLLAGNDGLNSVYKQVILGDQMAGQYTKGFKFDGTLLVLEKEEFGGFVACTAAKGIKQVYWYRSGERGEVQVGSRLVILEIGFMWLQLWSVACRSNLICRVRAVMDTGNMKYVAENGNIFGTSDSSGPRIELSA
ncbi:hypothetical protein BDW72DRAFT_201648 [Aspergillus terricola var. indicus]